MDIRTRRKLAQRQSPCHGTMLQSARETRASVDGSVYQAAEDVDTGRAQVLERLDGVRREPDCLVGGPDGARRGVLQVEEAALTLEPRARGRGYGEEVRRGLG